MTKKCLISMKSHWQSHCPHPGTPEYCNPVLPLSLLPALNFAKINHKKRLTSNKSGSKTLLGLTYTGLFLKRRWRIMPLIPACPGAKVGFTNLVCTEVKISMSVKGEFYQGRLPIWSPLLGPHSCLWKMDKPRARGHFPWAPLLCLAWERC